MKRYVFFTLTILTFLFYGCRKKEKGLNKINVEVDETAGSKNSDSKKISESEHDENIQRKQNLFEDLYENTPASAEECSKNPAFKLEYFTREADNLSFYAKKSAVEEECIASGLNVKVTYWKNKRTNFIQILELYGKTSLHSLSQYIGVKREKLIKDFPEIPLEETELPAMSLSSKDWVYFISFELENDVVKSIVLGKNL